MTSFSRVGIVARFKDSAIAPVVARAVAAVTANDSEVLLERDAAPLVPEFAGQTPKRHDLVEHCDLLIVIGGDGTLLAAGRLAAPKNVPVLGVNLGRLGFMVDVLPDDLEKVIAEVLCGNYQTESRMLMSIKIGEESIETSALNDVVVRHAEAARMLEFDTLCDGQFISHHRADGMIIATPTGSTAYALSCGGPVLHPALSAFSLVPISPHTLSDRPLVLDGDCQIGINISENLSGEATVSCDGQIDLTVPVDTSIQVSRSPHTLRIIHPRDYDYFRILRDKLHWGRGQNPRSLAKPSPDSRS